MEVCTLFLLLLTPAYRHEGADYILAECDPGDLDPHAVSSILKTFLRERAYYVTFFMDLF